MIRWFARWDTPIPNPELDELVRTRHAINISVRPRTDTGENILWADLASALPGDDLYRQMEVIIDNVASIGPNVYFTFNHEAETRDSAPNGTAQEFVGAWRVFYEILRDRTGPLTDPSDPNQIAAVYTVGNSGFFDGRAEEFYPGDDYVDVVGADIYNWYTCQGSDREWLQLDELLSPGLAFARARDKPLAIPEFGSAEDPADPNRKGEWMRQAAATLNSPELTDDLLFSAWFDVTAPGGAWPNCVWNHDSSFETFLGFEELLGATAKNG
jgi:beta-mannanase